MAEGLFVIYSRIPFGRISGFALLLFALGLYYEKDLPPFVIEMGGIIFIFFVGGMSWYSYSKRKEIAKVKFSKEKILINGISGDSSINFPSTSTKITVYRSIRRSTIFKIKLQQPEGDFSIRASQADLAEFLSEVEKFEEYQVGVKKVSGLQILTDLLKH